MKNYILFAFISICSWGYSLKPERNYIARPDTMGLNYESHRIKTTDQVEIQTWILNPLGDLNRETSIILAYGDAGNMSYWINQAAILSQKGYTVVLFDYRGFGESSDFEMDENQLYYDEFTADLVAVFNWTNAHIKNQKIGVWGLSMGTIMTGFLLNEVKPDFVILEGVVVNPTNIQKKIQDAKGKEVALPLNSLDLNEIYLTTKVPMLIFSGTEDQFTTVEDANALADMQKERTSLVFQGGHLQGFQSMSKESFGDEYVKSINEFIIKIKVG